MTQHADPRTFAAAPAGLGGPVDGPAMAPPPGAPPGSAGRYGPGPAPAGPVPSDPYGAGAMPPGPPSPPQGFGPLPMPTFDQHPAAAPPEPPLNTMAVVSVVAAFVVSPVAIVLGVLARKQIDRSGERGKGLATLGTVLGAVFTVIGVITTIAVLVLASAATTITAVSSPAPVVSAAPAVPSASAAAPAAPTGATDVQGKAQIMAAYATLGTANQTFNEALEAASDRDGVQAACKAYLPAVQQFRADVAAADLTAEQRAQVDGQLIPALDKVIADLKTLSTSQSTSVLQKALDSFQADATAVETSVQSVLTA